MSSDLRRFVESRIGFLEHCFDVWKASEDRHQRASAKYSFKQAFFYAALNYMEWRPLSFRGCHQHRDRVRTPRRACGCTLG